MNVANKTVLITGGARGIGLGVAQVLSRGGAKIVLVDQRPDDLDQAVQSLRDTGVDAHGVAADIASRSDNDRMVAEAVGIYGRLDALVVNAAASRRGSFLAMTEDDVQFTFSASLIGAFYSCQAGARQLIAQGDGGSLLIMSSVHVLRHYPNAALYNMAKAAVTSLSKTLAAELAPHRIRVNAILPGWTETPGELAFAPAEHLRHAGGQLPFGRLAQPQDIGHAARYLLSDEAAYVTGCELLVDGGFTLAQVSLSQRGDQPEK